MLTGIMNNDIHLSCILGRSIFTQTSGQPFTFVYCRLEVVSEFVFFLVIETKHHVFDFFVWCWVRIVIFGLVKTFLKKFVFCYTLKTLSINTSKPGNFFHNRFSCNKSSPSQRFFLGTTWDNLDSSMNKSSSVSMPWTFLMWAFNEDVEPLTHFNILLHFLHWAVSFVWRT